MSTYVFIDGGAVLQFMADAAQRLTPDETAPINYDRMRATFRAERVFFYDAYPTKRTGEDEEQFTQRWNEKDAFFKQPSRLDAMHVRTGTTRHRKKRGLEQKGVDIQLAIEAYQHAVRGNIETAVIVTNDLDFYPLLDAMTQTRVRTRLRYDRGKTSEALIEAADFAYPLSLEEFAAWCDPPYANHGGISRAKRDTLPQDNLEAPEIKRGNLLGRELVVYRHIAKNMYIVLPGPKEDLVWCNNLAAGIDWIEIHMGGRVILDEEKD
jgi:uncharacterized LabA/DUF88 family protein